MKRHLLLTGIASIYTFVFSSNCLAYTIEAEENTFRETPYLSEDACELYRSIGINPESVRSIAELSRPYSDFKMYYYATGLDISNSPSYDVMFSVDYCSTFGTYHPLTFMSLSGGSYTISLNTTWNTMEGHCVFQPTSNGRITIGSMLFQIEDVSDLERNVFNTMISNGLLIYDPVLYSLKKNGTSLSVSSYESYFSNDIWAIGDLDHNGLITENDSQLLAQLVANAPVPNCTDEMRDVADVNFDGVVTVTDVTCLLQYLNGNINSFTQ